MRVNVAPDPPFRIYIPVRLLRKYAREAEIIVRAGAAANAITALDRLNPRKPTTNAASRRDAVQVSLMMSGYLYELVKTLGEYGDEGWELARQGIGDSEIVAGVPWTLAKVRAELATQSVLISVAKTFRDKFGFHWDADVFRPLLSRYEDDKFISFIIQEELGMPNTVFEPPQMALIDHFPEDRVSAAMEAVARLAPMTPYLVVGMINGLFAKAGENPIVRQVLIRDPQKGVSDATEK